MNKLSQIVLFVFFSVLLCGCNAKYNKILNSSDLDLKYEKAKAYYNEGNYYKAIPLFEEMIALQRGNMNLEDIYYSYAYSYYGQGDYILAAYHFKTFISLYPSSEKVQDATYMIAQCFYEQSPRQSLDQTATWKAIQAYQDFATSYPSSDKMPMVNDRIDELRNKLMNKAYDSAYLYYKTKKYRAAITSFKNLIIEYPNLDKKVEAEFYIVKSNKLLADNSYEEKQLERYQSAIEAANIFKAKYPDSDYIKEIEDIYSQSVKSIENLNKNSKDERKQERRS